MGMMCSEGVSLFSPEEENRTDTTKEILKSVRELYGPYHGYICSVICAFGLLTNVINVIVLTKRQMRTSINVLLTGIAVCDMGTMASYLIYILHFVLTDLDCNPYLYTYGWMFFLMCHIMLSIALHSTSLWLAVAMAFVRSMTLRQARLSSPWLKADNAWKICIIVYACVFVFCVPSVFSNGITTWNDYYNRSCETPKQMLMMERYELDHQAYTIDVPPNNCVVVTITFWLSGMLFKIVPCLLLALLIISLLCTIKRAERHRKALLAGNRTGRSGDPPAASAPRHHRTDRTTTMLVAILGLFLLTELPQGVVAILSGIYVGHMRDHVYPFVADFLDLFSLINSSVNFVLYCAMSSKYRQVFWQVVLPRRLYVRWYVRQRRSTKQRKRRTAQTPQTATGGLMQSRDYLGAEGPDGAGRNAPLRDEAVSCTGTYAPDEDTFATTNDASPFRNGRTTAAFGANESEAEFDVFHTPSSRAGERGRWSCRRPFSPRAALGAPGTTVTSFVSTSMVGAYQRSASEEAGNREEDYNPLHRRAMARATLLANDINANVRQDSVVSKFEDGNIRGMRKKRFLSLNWSRFKLKRGGEDENCKEKCVLVEKKHTGSLCSRRFRLKRGDSKWLIACSCLRKCACKNGAGSGGQRVAVEPVKNDRSNEDLMIGESSTVADKDMRVPLCPSSPPPPSAYPLMGVPGVSEVRVETVTL